jgi:hypothetical protein
VEKTGESPRRTRSRRGPEKSQRCFRKSGNFPLPGRKRQRRPWRDGSSNGTKAKHEGSQHHRDGGLKALRLEPQSAVSPDVSLPFRGSSETTGECTCFTGAQDTTQHVLEECEEEGSLGETEKTARGHKGCLPLPSDRPDQRRESKKEINSRKKQR